MLKHLLNTSLKAAAVAALALGACATAQAADDALYLCDVANEAELTADVFGVPMAVDKVGDVYVARYYNQKANNPIYFLCNKVDFSDAWGLIGGELSTDKVSELDPIVLPEANKYYEITLDLDNLTYDVKTYEPADYMDPIIFEQGSNSLNTWWAWEDTGTDDWVGKDDAWWQEFYIGVMPNHPDNEILRFHVDANNPHLYYTDALPISKFTDEKGAEENRLNFTIHNWHSHGWWNYCSWRFDDGIECERVLYCGGVVKKAYLDWAFGEGNVDWAQWVAEESYRGQFVPDNWCHTPMPEADGDYVLIFDSHLGRAKLVPVEYTGIKPVIATEEGQAVYYNLQGQVRNASALTPGIYIKRQGTKAEKVLVK